MTNQEIHRHVSEARKIVAGMPTWFRGVDIHKTSAPCGRTVNEEFFDSGVFAASELVRRLTGDEALALAIHEACIWRQREVAAKELERLRTSNGKLAEAEKENR